MHDASILVISCDRYADLWRPFFTLFFRYWPDCPYPVFLGTNERSYDDPRVTTLTVGPDDDWAAGALAMLEEVPSEYAIVLLEDYLLHARADTALVVDLVDLAVEKGAGCLRLVPVPGAERGLPGTPGVGELPRGVPYRVSLQAAVWNRATLARLLTPGESPWLLETAGSRRSDAFDEPFLAVTQSSPWPLPYLATGVVRGRWLREAVELCRREGIDPDLSARPVETPWQRLRRTRTPAAALPLLAVASRLRR